MWLGQYVLLFGTISVVEKGNAMPFLYNPSQTIASFLSSSSLSPAEPEAPLQSNIADLRIKPSHQRSSKLLLRQDEMYEMSTTETSNDVLPGLVQKKIAKILRKLQFLASVQNSVTTNGEDAGRHDDFDDFDTNSKENSTDPNATEPALDDVDIKDERDAPKTTDSQYSIGLYLLELLGSIFGLAYGAAVQFQEAQKSTTPRDLIF